MKKPMFSTKLHQMVQGFDEVVNVNADDFEQSDPKVPSVIRYARLAVISEEMLVGCIGEIGDERLHRIRRTLVDWIQMIFSAYSAVCAVKFPVRFRLALVRR